MKRKRLLLIFVKNIRFGKVKTRLAKSIGDDAAFEVYKHLVEITEQETRELSHIDLHIYFSDSIIDSKWKNTPKYIQEGEDLGLRMKNAFNRGFEMGYTSIVGIGSDLPDLNKELILEAFDILEKNEAVFGPASDGGYYLLGLKKTIDSVFINKPWSTDQLLNITLFELKKQGVFPVLLKELNDIDTLEDLRISSISDRFKHFLK